MLIQSIIEIIVVVALIVGLFNESKIADWEQRQFEKIKAKFAEGLQ